MVSAIAKLGALVPVMAGIALGARLQKKNIVAMTYIGDGGTSTGAFHEGANLAAVQRLPLVIVAENNGWAYSTPFRKQTAARYVPGEELRDWASRDPLERYARVLLESGVADGGTLHAIDAELAARVESDARAVEQTPFPAPETALRGVYAERIPQEEPAVVRRNG